MRKSKLLFMLCLFGMISMGAKAEDIPNNEIWYEASAKLAETYSKYDSGLHTNAFNTTIKSHTFSAGKGVVTFNADVTSIGDYAFYGCSGLTSVTIPNSVTSIGSYAFARCSGLTSVTIPNSVTSIGGSAFQGCSGLTSVTIPNSVTSIGDYAFGWCSGLTSMTIPNSVTSIGNSAFSGCSGLTNPVYNNTIFAYMPTSYSGSYSIPNGITTIAAGAFNECSDLTSVTIPNSVTSIGSSAFSGCSGLISVTIPNSVTSIEDYVFENCSGLTSVTIPNSVTSIGYSAFRYCSGLTCVTISNSVTGERAFAGCSNLTTVTFNGDKVRAVFDSHRISHIYSLSENPPFVPYDISNYGSTKVEPALVPEDIYRYAYVHIPQGSYEAYSSAFGWRKFARFKEDMNINSKSYYYTLKVKQDRIGYVEHAVKANEEYTVSLDNRNIKNIVSIKFNGEEVKSKIVNGKFTTPAIDCDSELEIIYAGEAKGDANADGAVDVADITKIASTILNSDSKEDVEENMNY